MIPSFNNTPTCNPPGNFIAPNPFYKRPHEAEVSTEIPVEEHKSKKIDSKSHAQASSKGVDQTTTQVNREKRKQRIERTAQERFSCGILECEKIVTEMRYGPYRILLCTTHARYLNKWKRFVPSINTILKETNDYHIFNKPTFHAINALYWEFKEQYSNQRLRPEPSTEQKKRKATCTLERSAAVSPKLETPAAAMIVSVKEAAQIVFASPIESVAIPSTNVEKTKGADEDTSIELPQLKLQKQKSVDPEDKDYVRLNDSNEFELFLDKDTVRPIAKRLRIAREINEKPKLFVTEADKKFLNDLEKVKYNLVVKLYDLTRKYDIPHPLIVRSPKVALDDFQRLLEKSGSALVGQKQPPESLYHIKVKNKLERSFCVLHSNDDFYRLYVSNPNLFFFGSFVRNDKFTMEGKEAALFASAEHRMTVKKDKRKGKTTSFSIEETWDNKEAFVYSMRLLWTNIGNKLTKKNADGTDKNDDRIIGTHMLRRILTRNSNGCADWPPVVYKGLVHLIETLPGFPVTEELETIDPSGGFGGRIIARLATKKGTHTVFDPNTNLIPGYKKILTTLAPNSAVKVKMIMKPSEEMTAKDFAPNQLFHLAITSPPYFVQEIYSDEETQSSSRYPNVDAWINDYMCRTLFKIWKRLIPGGVIALNLADCTGVKKEVICEPILAFLKKLGLGYRGCIGRKAMTTYEPIWTFQKPVNNDRYSVYDLTFKGAENRSIENLSTQYRGWLKLPDEEKNWRRGFFLPKLWNSVLKYRMKAIDSGRNSLDVDREISHKLNVETSYLSGRLETVKKVKTWQVLSGKGEDVIEITEPQSLTLS